MRPLPALVSVWLLAVAVCADSGQRAQTRAPSNCRDHAGRPGVCGTVHDCPPLLALVSNGRRPSAEEVSQLRRSQCRGPSGSRRRVLLCCALPPPPPPPAAPEEPFDGEPEEHPNRRLLERGEPCGSSLVPRITGGKEVRHGQHPWMALIGYRHSETGRVSYRCGGALIGRRHVLTAAHCLVSLPAQLRLDSVRLGDHNLSRPTDCALTPDGRPVCGVPQEFRIAALFIHSDYNKPSARLNDIALLKLDRPVVEDNFVGKICLPFDSTRQRNYTGVGLSAVGFGSVGPGRDSPSSEVLLEVVLPGVDQQRCAAAVRRLGGLLGPRQMCAGGEPGRDVCFGDSGAPLVADPGAGELAPTLVGLVAYGARLCDGAVPGVFTRVSSYLNWILDRIDD
ncbi:Melanization protease 1 [Amphibalanus amphitrite]|uniref:CLIP domain-containing serine protease n=1 Tax=Amphibalanus amphitrite TaxID=1232801 RepID=A0A6A4XBC5_AMPAM|nr:Melanization protease 1 [Amphibalanus amphitrite]